MGSVEKCGAKTLNGKTPVCERGLLEGGSSEKVCTVGMVWQMREGGGGQSSDLWEDARAVDGGLCELEFCGREIARM